MHLAHLDGKVLTKSRACKLIPLRNANSQIKYVNQAAADGFLSFAPDPEDARVTSVRPGPRLAEFIDGELARFRHALVRLLPTEGSSPDEIE